jgi:hypothetical protein
MLRKDRKSKKQGCLAVLGIKKTDHDEQGLEAPTARGRKRISHWLLMFHVRGPRTVAGNSAMGDGQEATNSVA